MHLLATNTAIIDTRSTIEGDILIRDNVFTKWLPTS